MRRTGYSNRPFQRLLLFGIQNVVHGVIVYESGIQIVACKVLEYLAACKRDLPISLSNGIVGDPRQVEAVHETGQREIADRDVLAENHSPHVLFVDVVDVDVIDRGDADLSRHPQRSYLDRRIRVEHSCACQYSAQLVQRHPVDGLRIQDIGLQLVDRQLARQCLLRGPRQCVLDQVGVIDPVDHLGQNLVGYQFRGWQSPAVHVSQRLVQFVEERGPRDVLHQRVEVQVVDKGRDIIEYYYCAQTIGGSQILASYVILQFLHDTESYIAKADVSWEPAQAWSEREHCYTHGRTM